MISRWNRTTCDGGCSADVRLLGICHCSTDGIETRRLLAAKNGIISADLGYYLFGVRSRRFGSLGIFSRC